MAVDRYSGLDPNLGRKAPVRVATTGNITLSGTQTIDGVALSVGDRVLVRAQTSGVNNGIYVVASSAWTRAADFNRTNDAVRGTSVLVGAGSTYGGSEFYVSTTNPLIGSGAIAFTQRVGGDPGVSVSSATVDGSGDLVLTLSNGATLNAGHVVGGTGAAAAPDATLFDTRAAITSATIPSGVHAIYTAGYSAVGDGGHGRYVRYTGTPADITHPGWVKSLDGQWWQLVIEGFGVRIEQFGGRGDYDVVNQSTGFATANPTPTDNHGPLIKAATFLFTAKPNYFFVGPAVTFGTGGFYFGSVVDTTDFARVITLQGAGVATLNGPTRLVFAAGVKGFYLPINRHINFRNLEIFSLGTGGLTDKHGIHAEAPVVMEHCTVTGFGGHGCYIAADVGATPASNANLWNIRHCTFQNNAGSGLRVLGGDANAGSAHSCNFLYNGRYGLEDTSFLGNGHADHHASSNTLGAYYIVNDNARTALLNCYSESDQPPSYAQGFISVIGGMHAAGVTLGGGHCMTQFGNTWSGGVWLYPPDGTTDTIAVGLRHQDNLILSFGKAGSVYEHDWRYYANEGYMLNWRNLGGEWGFGISPEEGSQRRNPRIPPNRILAPRPIYFGSAYDQMRGFSTTSGRPGDNGVQRLRGDFELETTGEFLGWFCFTADTSGNSNTAVWKKAGQLGDTVYDTFTVPSLAAGAVSSEFTISAPGSSRGDAVDVDCYNADTQGIQAVSARISADGTATWRFWNPTGSTINLGSTGWGITWRRPFWDT